MIGIIFSIAAGALMSFQGVFNTRLNDKIGIWEANVFVHGTALILSLIILFFAASGDFKKLLEVDKIYLTGGIIGVLITFTVIKGISALGPTCAISTILVAQLLTAAVIDRFSLFGVQPIEFGWTKFLGIGVMIIGIILFKLKI
ncbi:MAG: DMT family transporter [Clostridium sp.]